jgi:hypothetical protein
MHSLMVEVAEFSLNHPQSASLLAPAMYIRQSPLLHSHVNKAEVDKAETRSGSPPLQ